MNASAWFKLIILLSLIALVGDSVLTYNKLTDSAVGCPAGGGCDIVKGSIYSEFMGIPVSVIGGGAFLFFILLALLALSSKISNEWAFKGILAAGAIGVLAAVYFIYIMLFVLDAICPWCFLSHFMLFGVVISAYVGLQGNGKNEIKKRARKR